MALKKAVKMEILVLVETSLSDEEVLKWTKIGLEVADFDEAIVKIVEKHDKIVVDSESEATA